jgi:hypothetical protein
VSKTNESKSVVKVDDLIGIRNRNLANTKANVVRGDIVTTTGDSGDKPVELPKSDRRK